MNPTRRTVLASGATLLVPACSGCLGIVDSLDGSDGSSESVDRFRVRVSYGGTWRGDIRYSEGDDTLVRVPFAATYQDPDVMEVTVPDDLRNPDEVGTIQPPISFSTTDIGGSDGPSEDNPFEVVLYVDGEEVDSDRVTTAGEDARVSY